MTDDQEAQAIAHPFPARFGIQQPPWQAMGGGCGLTPEAEAREEGYAKAPVRQPQGSSPHNPPSLAGEGAAVEQGAGFRHTLGGGWLPDQDNPKEMGS